MNRAGLDVKLGLRLMRKSWGMTLILVGVLALAGPARRALGINPVDALRSN